MANGLLQLRIDDNLRREAAAIYSQLGLDLPTAIRMFLTRSVQVRGIPFSVQLPDEDYKATAALAAMKRVSRMAEENGISDMTPDEIDAEIAAVRSTKP
ncbi:type II toxin-antitoxin system RelB/DinJ family antitoxin [Fretibacterium sp. OH1220_COT-178]|uniref:type II toxin-antitoxin system RelB/DinJ family antitoxin n=1 Tax=Fretibacterium sp. OH1220_COT-178 TaxID=2491047 RepID=UPI000F5E2268|nr:type II toxin-antitoxin system RelB/DinJ family antitoxin [Fretibacterium sp. OH1220_COT-178]RRD64269.1 type II toxin-antitoxin system RelB/DinJ family antitoxin [Fretibacterium sp. OH1220_COT-178]